jgi:hypothetical protein
MDSPLPLLLLLALPLVAALVIVAVSAARRRRSARAHGAVEPVHRGQADTAAVQSAVVHPPTARRKVLGGRERRGGAGQR